MNIKGVFSNELFWWLITLHCIYYIKGRNNGKSPYEILYSFKQYPSEFNERKVITGLDNKEKLESIYFDPKEGFSGINDLVRKSE